MALQGTGQGAGGPSNQGTHTIRGAVAEPGPDHPALGLRQILDEKGIADPALVPALGARRWLEIYAGMLTVRIMDERLFSMQRQGRVGFYGEARGQEAAVIGSAATLGERDWILPALREAGAAIFRGLPLRTYIAQIFGNANDVGLGHQLPCHPGTRESRYVTMSSCIATQLPHATGMALAARLRGEDAVVLGYLGDGASSEADFHVALNFAGVLRVPVVFVCQNNQWGISTPVSVQTASKTIAIKAHAYGIPGVRVDGNDVFAVYSAVSEAVEHARRGHGPTLVEALTYRVGPHSTSDDPSRYRDENVTQQWVAKRDPIARFKRWLVAQGHLTEERDVALRAAIDNDVREAVAAEEPVAPVALHTLIEQVFAEVPRFLEDELAEIADLPRQKLGGVHQ